MRIAALVTLGLVVVAADVRADPNDSVAKLEAAGGSMSWSYVPQGRSERFGHAEALVAAPPIYVRDQAVDFVHYKDLSNGRIRTSRLVDKRPGSTDVYFQVPVLHGMLTLWQVLRFGDVHKAADGTETFTGKLVRGNVHAAEMTFTIRPAGNGRSIVALDMMLEPGFAAPQSMVDAELRDAAQSAVRALAAHAEHDYVASLPAQQHETTVAESR